MNQILLRLQKLVDEYPTHYGKMLDGPHQKELHAYLHTNFEGVDTKEKVYHALTGIATVGCRNCGKPTPFISVKLGYRTVCNKTCQDEYVKRTNEAAAIAKLNGFAKFEYISGYTGSHAKVKVTNHVCGCTFDAIYLNLFGNPNYCPTHGGLARANKLVDRNALGLSEQSLAKRKLAFDVKRADKLARIKLENEITENQLLLEGRDVIIDFMTVLSNECRSGSELLLQRLPKLHKLIQAHYGERFGQKLYNYINQIDTLADHPSCPVCSSKNDYQTSSNRYNAHCSKTCVQNDPLVREATKQTSFDKYGSWFTSTSEWSDKTIATNLDKYGTENPMQNKEVQDRAWASQYRLKPVRLPSGKEIKLMGYEPQVLEHLFSSGYVEEDFVFSNLPVFRYNTHRYYFPDFYISGENLIIEVKSAWTYCSDIEVTLQKKAAVIAAGYNYQLIVWDDKLKLPLTQLEIEQLGFKTNTMPICLT